MDAARPSGPDPAGRAARRVRVGSVPYLVARPLDLGLGAEPGVELVHDVPARLVEGLRSGRLDVALVSSIELFRRPGYRYLDGLGVCGRGEVSSVRVFLRAPLADVRTLALDPASHAAAALVQVVLSPDLGASPGPVEFLEAPAGTDPRDVAADAWLRIGDRALREVAEPGGPPWFDPAAAWTRATGLPFAFAAWIVAPGARLPDDVLAAFARSHARGAAAVEHLAREGARAMDLPEELVLHYLTRECLYEPGAELAPALRAFRDAAARLELGDASLDPAPLPLPCPRA